MDKQKSNNDEFEDDKSIKNKESKPIKNSVQFQSNELIDGYDNKSFENDKNDKIVQFKNRPKNERK